MTEPYLVILDLDTGDRPVGTPYRIAVRNANPRLTAEGVSVSFVLGPSRQIGDLAPHEDWIGDLDTPPFPGRLVAVAWAEQWVERKR